MSSTYAAIIDLNIFLTSQGYLISKRTYGNDGLPVGKQVPLADI